MVQILLDFIRAQRDGLWDMYLESFAAILPWLTIYDHTNYARWRPIVLTEMANLSTTAPDILNEFKKGNFVVKISKHRFNQVSADQGTEWVNKICKLHNGVIGITQNDCSRDKFCLTWAMRCDITESLKHLLNMCSNDEELSVISRGDSNSNNCCMDN